MSYEMRPLKTSDIFAMSKILKKMKIKFEVEKGISQEAMGVQMIQKILENLHLAQHDVNDFLADLVGITGKDFNDLPITDTIKIIGLFKEQPGLVDFLKLANK